MKVQRASPRCLSLLDAEATGGLGKEVSRRRWHHGADVQAEKRSKAALVGAAAADVGFSFLYGGKSSKHLLPTWGLNTAATALFRFIGSPAPSRRPAWRLLQGRWLRAVPGIAGARRGIPVCAHRRASDRPRLAVLQHRVYHQVQWARHPHGCLVDRCRLVPLLRREPSAAMVADRHVGAGFRKVPQGVEARVRSCGQVRRGSTGLVRAGAGDGRLEARRRTTGMVAEEWR